MRSSRTPLFTGSLAACLQRQVRAREEGCETCMLHLSSFEQLVEAFPEFLGFIDGRAERSLSGFSPVSLWSSFVGDIVTSLVRPLVDLAYSSCYVFSGEWLRRPDRQGSCHAAICGASPGNALLTALPLFFRFLQNLRAPHEGARDHLRGPASTRDHTRS